MSNDNHKDVSVQTDDVIIDIDKQTNEQIDKNDEQNQNNEDENKLIEKDNISKNGNDWKIEEEMILKSWSEKASCFQVMHDRSFKRFWCLNAWFAVPVIIISTLTGTGNFAQNSLPEEYKIYAPYIIGALNIIAGIVSTIAQFLVVAQRMEGHRISSINWDKFGRRIKTELSKKKTDRQTIT